MTRQPVAGRTFTVEEALEALEEWRHASSLLDEDEASIAEPLELVRRYQVRGKQVHDCNIVAVMLTHRVTRLATRNPQNFARYPEVQVEPVTP